MQQGHRKKPSQYTPVNGLLDWEALRRHAYRLLRSGPVCGWPSANREEMAQKGLMRVAKALDEGAVVEHVVKTRMAGAVDEDRFAAWCSTIDRHMTTDDWRMQRGRDSARTVVEMTSGYGLTSAEVAHVLGLSGCHRPYPAQQSAPQVARERTGGITPMAHSQSSLPPASRPDITAFAEELRTRLPQRRMLPPEEV
jgi:hypothetical protein